MESNAACRGGLVDFDFSFWSDCGEHAGIGCDDGPADKWLMLLILYVIWQALQLLLGNKTWLSFLQPLAR